MHSIEVHIAKLRQIFGWNRCRHSSTARHAHAFINCSPCSFLCSIVSGYLVAFIIAVVLLVAIQLLFSFYHFICFISGGLFLCDSRIHFLQAVCQASRIAVSALPAAFSIHFLDLRFCFHFRVDYSAEREHQSSHHDRYSQLSTVDPWDDDATQCTLSLVGPPCLFHSHSSISALAHAFES
jgi:hypothetical protein